MSGILVTGATGFLGGAVARRLVQAGRCVVATGRDPARCAQLAATGARVVTADLQQPNHDQALRSELGAAKVTRILHCAGLSAPFGRSAGFVAANVDVTRALLAMARDLGVQRFVFVSSPTVTFAFKDRLNVKEADALPAPVNAYAATKRHAEVEVLAASDLGPIVLRPRGLYGAGDTALLPRLIRVAERRSLPVFRRGEAAIDLTYIDDAARACIAALDAGDQAAQEIYHVSGGEPLPVREIVDQACARCGVTPRWKPRRLRPMLALARAVETVALALPGAPEPPVTPYTLGLFAYAQSLDVSKARERLDWSPQVRFADGLQATFSQQEKARL